MTRFELDEETDDEDDDDEFEDDEDGEEDEDDEAEETEIWQVSPAAGSSSKDCLRLTSRPETA